MNNISPQTVVPDCVGCKAVDLRCGVVCSRGGGGGGEATRVLLKELLSF